MKKGISKKIGLWVMGAFLLILPAIAVGQLTPKVVEKVNSLEGVRQTLLCGFLYWLYTLAIIIGVVYIIIAAYKYMTAGGEAEGVKSAHKSLTYGVIGILVAILAYGVPNIVYHFVAGESFDAICTDTSSTPPE
jgi:uncharacterized membrane protein